MAWRPITTDEVTQEFSNQEVQSIAALAQGGSLSNVPNLAVILGNVVNMVRGSIIAGGNAVSSIVQPNGQIVPDGSVPDQLRLDVIAVARWRWLSTAPALNALKTKDREDLYKDAIKRFQDVANGKEKIELPPTITAQEAPVNQVQTVTHQRRKTVHFQSGTGLVRDQLRGLI